MIVDGGNVFIQAKQLWYSLLLIVFTGLLSGCGAIPEKKIFTSIDIDAPSDLVWNMLIDNKRYPEWNPYHVQVNGMMAEGAKLDLLLHKPNGETVEIEPHVMRIVPKQELTWGGGIKGIFFGEHVFLLSPLSNRQTRLIQKESFSGLAIPFASLDAIEEGYQQMNLALKQRAEQQYLQDKNLH